ncbi:MAG: S8 family peptidase, partial [Bacteroidota bacterium]
GKLAAATDFLASLGFTGIIDDGSESFVIAGFFPIDNLLLLNERPDILNFARPAFPAVSNAASGGAVKTRGDEAMRSNLARLGYADLAGTGIKLGVLSDSYNTIGEATGDIANGDLPGPGNLYGLTNPVQVVREYPFGKRPDEGRAMLQIAHDVAPGAALAFRTGFITAGDFARGIRELQQAGCDVIVDDITYPTEPFFRDGKVARAITDVTAQGVSYFTAAGNFGSRSIEGTFRPAAAPAGFNGSAHDFDAGDRFQRISVAPGTYTIVLQWEDDIASLGTTAAPLPGARNDLDIYLTPDEGATRFGSGKCLDRSLRRGGEQPLFPKKQCRLPIAAQWCRCRVRR